MLKVSFKTERADWGFIVPSTLIWISSLLVTVWDFVTLQVMIYRFSPASVLGSVLFLAGLSLRLLSRMTLGKYYSYGLKPPEKLITHGIYKRTRHPCYFAILLYTMGTPLAFSSLYGFVITIGVRSLHFVSHKN
ncbi:MAG: methyltransferase [Candidatus Bathyarchaeia archaeon]